jgi:hypothetical protein
MTSPLAPSRGDSRGGHGSANHDLPFEFGHLPRAIAPAPFTLHEYARLLVLRSRLSEQALHRRRYAAPRAEPTPATDTTTEPAPDRTAECATESPARESRVAAAFELAILVLALVAFALLLIARGMITL